MPSYFLVNFTSGNTLIYSCFIIFFWYFWLFAAKISIYSIKLRLFRKINDAIIFFDKFYSGEHPYLILFYKKNCDFWLFATKISIYSIKLRLFRKIIDAIVFFGKFYIGETPYYLSETDFWPVCDINWAYYI